MMMGCEVVHHDDVAGQQGRCQHLRDIGAESIGGHWSVEHQGRGHAVQAQSTGKGDGFPMPVRNGGAAPLPAPGTAARAGHLRRRGSLIYKDEPLRIEVRLLVEPRLASCCDVGALLFAGVRGFF
jgi:hypothetical protein